jgi:23S rRNA (cytosine1962-C5)-methyltransferase
MQNECEPNDNGNGCKLERLGKYALARPAADLVWATSLPASTWDRADAWFDRDGGNNWSIRNPPPLTWNITVGDVVFKLNTTHFEHLGIFPEQVSSWETIEQFIRDAHTRHPGGLAVLSLFVYSDKSTMAASRAGPASVTWTSRRAWWAEGGRTRA